MHDATITTPQGHRIPAPPGRPIVLMLHGSHLYGTDTVDSDFDYKGVFVPNQRDILLGRIPKQISTSTGREHEKNQPGDVDCVWFSLHEFVKLACEGQTVAIDMLHAQRDWTITESSDWRRMRSQRDRFRTRSMKAFLGYCQKQAAKYGVKGSRLAAARWALHVLEGTHGSLTFRVSDLEEFQPDSLVRSGHAEFVYWETKGERTFLNICGRKIQDTTKLLQAQDPIRKFVENYGERARQAESNEGIDWKALSHALRAGYQLRQLYKEGIITFPLEEAPFLLEVKQGQHDYTSVVAPALEGIVAEVTCLSDDSDYPDGVDREFWDDFIVSITEPHQW